MPYSTLLVPAISPSRITHSRLFRQAALIDANQNLDQTINRPEDLRGAGVRGGPKGKGGYTSLYRERV